jgi:hypothetical protein
MGMKRGVFIVSCPTNEVRVLIREEVIAVRKGESEWEQPTGWSNGLHKKDILEAVDIMLVTDAASVRPLPSAGRA